MSDIERVPSMRKPARQGVPKRKPRDTAKPVDQGRTKDAPLIAPKTVPERAVEPAVEPVPVLPEEPVLAEEPAQAPEPEPSAAPGPAPQLKGGPEPGPEPGSRPAQTPLEAPPLTMRAMFARVEPAFAEFRAAAYRYPAEHMNDRIGEEGWTRKQMLAHIATWHDLTTDRLIKAGITGQPVTLDRDQEAINTAAARVAIGKTAGEVLKDVEATYARLRRQMLRMTDADLRLGDGWAAERIASNTYDHYAEHMADLVPPVPPPGTGAQR